METIILMLMLMLMMTPCLTSSCPPPPPPPTTFLHRLHRRCPLQIPPPSLRLPLEMDGEALEQVSRSTSKDLYVALLFYDYTSPFSSGVHSKFHILSSMFPQVPHIAVERSVAMPSLFSRYGIHSLPALFLVNHTADVRFYGPKELSCLTDFYKRITGLEPVGYHVNNDGTEIKDGEMVLQLWYQSSWRDIVVKEPYLVFAILFLVLRGFIYICPELWCHVAALWMFCKCQFNVGILGDSNQLLGRVAHLMDVKRVWSKLKLWKTGNFQKGAISARAWASSLASVSLGESSSTRSLPAVES